MAQETLRQALERRVEMLKRAIEVDAYPHLTMALKIEVEEMEGLLALPDVAPIDPTDVQMGDWISYQIPRDKKPKYARVEDVDAVDVWTSGEFWLDKQWIKEVRRAR